jgi:hypothetical protein
VSSRRRRATLTLLPLLAVLAGCGNSRTPVPSLSQFASPRGFHAVRYPAAGFSLRAPVNWILTNRQTPLVAVFSSGAAVVAVWRYVRSTPPPAGQAALSNALAALIRAARARDSTFALIRSKLTTIDHATAIELDAFERIGGNPRRVRSTHIYVPGAELVLDEYAPPALFHAADHAVFSPVKRSLTLLSAGRTPPVAGA